MPLVFATLKVEYAKQVLRDLSLTFSYSLSASMIRVQLEDLLHFDAESSSGS